MKSLFAFFAFTLCSQVAVAKSQAEIIDEAMQQGARLVRCENHRCWDDQTKLKLGESDPTVQDGAYLLFPEDISSIIAHRVSRDLKEARR